MFRKQSSKAASVVSATLYFWAQLALGAALHEPDAHQAPLMCHPLWPSIAAVAVWQELKKKKKEGKKENKEK